MTTVHQWFESATIAAVIGAIIGSVVPLLAAWWTRPKLHIDFLNSANNIVTSPSVEGARVIWLRVRILNDGRRRARQCQAYVTAMYEVRSDGKINPSPALKDAKIMQWAGGSKKPTDIPQDIDFYADLLTLPGASAGWGFAFGLYSHQESLEQYQGTYELHLTASAENANPASCKIRIDCKKNEAPFKAWQV